MRTSTTLILGLFILCSKSIFAQDAPLTFEKVIYSDQTISSDEFTVEISNVVSTTAEAKFKFKITNKTADFLMFDASKCIIEIDGNKLTPKDKFIIIDPYDNKSKTISVTGAGLNKAKSYTFVLNGVQRVIPIDAPIEAPQFKLPASKNDFSAGKFNTQLKNSKKESGATFVKFDVQYKGDKIGFIMPSKIDVTMPDGNNYANSDTKGKTFLMFPGDSEKFTAQWGKMPGGRLNDMQLVEMLINFNGVFSEGEAKNLAEQTVTLSWSEELTKAANK